MYRPPKKVKNWQAKLQICIKFQQASQATEIDMQDEISISFYMNNNLPSNKMYIMQSIFEFFLTRFGIYRKNEWICARSYFGRGKKKNANQIYINSIQWWYCTAIVLTRLLLLSPQSMGAQGSLFGSITWPQKC